MKYLSLFTGIGGFELGIQQAYSLTDDFLKTTPENYPICVGYSEIDPYAIKIYQQHFNHKNYGDIKNIKPDELPEFDFLCGGFPCQSFSIAGKRKGFEDTRGTLFFDIARILKAKQPRRFLLENVKGLLSHDDGQTFRTIIATLDELGYDLQWQVLNSKHFGVPQNRERVFIVGHLRGTPRPEVFPFNGKTETSDRAIFIDESQWRREGKIREYQGISPTLNTAGGGGHLPLTANMQKAKQAVGEDYRGLETGRNSPMSESNEGSNPSSPTIIQTPRGYNKGGIYQLAPTLSSHSWQDNNHLIEPYIQNPKMQNFKKDYKNSVAITATSYKEPPVVNGIRRLTPVECERLQGFPDNWTQLGREYPENEYYKDEHKILEKFGIKISDSQRYKCLGNAVTVNVIQTIMERLLI